MTNHAQISERWAGLWTPFGLEFAQRRFPAEVLDAIPRYVRGKHKGAPKAVIVWEKVERGGWVGRGADDNGPVGRVETRKGKIIRCALYGVAPWGTDLPYQGKIADAAIGEDS